MEKQSLKMENSLCSFIAFSLQDEQEPTEQIGTLKRFHLLYIYSSAKNTNPFGRIYIASCHPWGSYNILHAILPFLGKICCAVVQQ